MRPIDADKVLSLFKAVCERCGKDKQYDGVMCRACEFEDAVDMIENAPTLDVKPVVHGGWINYKDSHQCDKCREFVFMAPHSWEDDELAYDFCPYCGADMRKEQT